MDKVMIAINEKLPINCLYCRLPNEISCNVNNKRYIGDKRPDSCPLVRIPDKKNVNFNHPIKCAEQSGYNDCIEEIIRGGGC